VVPGTMKDFKVVSERKDGGTTVRTGEGTLEVDEVLMGDSAKTLKLRWNIVPGLSSSFNPEGLSNRRGIWLLEKTTGADSEGILTVTHPGRFVEAEKLAAVKSLLQKPIYRIALKGDEYRAGKPMMATFIISTVKDEVKVPSFLRMEKGKLIFCGTAAIHISKSPGEIQRRQDRTATAPAQGAVTVKRGAPLEVEVDLARYFFLEKDGAHTIWWGASSELSSPRCSFYVVKK